MRFKKMEYSIPCFGLEWFISRNCNSNGKKKREREKKKKGPPLSTVATCITLFIEIPRTPQPNTRWDRIFMELGLPNIYLIARLELWISRLVAGIASSRVQVQQSGISNFIPRVRVWQKKKKKKTLFLSFAPVPHVFVVFCAFSWWLLDSWSCQYPQPRTVF